LSAQASNARDGRPPRLRSVGESFVAVLRASRAHRFTGDPRRDWLDARGFLADSGKPTLVEMANYAEQLPAFQRGQHIGSALSGLWQAQGDYATARQALDTAIAQDQLLSGGDDVHGIYVMTIHKSKSKEFDAVIILDDSNNSPLIYCKEQPPFPRSRKLFRVGITRARHHVLLLTDMYTPSPLVARLKL
jgi:DNA helicase-2/ATP-dependent DNA helicase PcrA